MLEAKPLPRNDETEALRAENEELRRRLRDHEGPHSHHGQRRSRVSAGVLWLLALLVVAGLAVAFFTGYLPQARRQLMLVTGTIDQSKVLPIVNVAKVQIS